LVLEGEALLRVGRLFDALKAFEAAGQKLTPQQLVACGEKCLEKGRLTDARVAFEAAGDQPGLLTCGARGGGKGWRYDARRALEAAGRKLTAEQLIVCGEKCLQQGRFGDALQAFEEAEAHRKAAHRLRRKVSGAGSAD